MSNNKIECKVEAIGEFKPLSMYWAKLTFSYDGKPLDLDDDLIKELAEEIDFTYGQEGNYEINNCSSIICEISKYHWGVFEFKDEYYKEETEDVMREHCESAESIFKKQLIRNLGIYNIASEIVGKKLLDNNEIVSIDKIALLIEQGFEEMDLDKLYNMSNEDVIKIIEKEFI